MTEHESIRNNNQNLIDQQEVDSQELKEKINDMYTNVALNPEDIYHFKMGRELAETLGYPVSVLEQIPDKSIESFAGVGYFFDMIELKPGDRVLDLGSGSGMDSFVAAMQVTDSGEVIGVDLNQDQLQKARKMKSMSVYNNIEFQENDIEGLPFEEESFDVIISNGVFNLVPNKPQLFQEISRLLKSGGRLAFSDIVTESQLPTSVKCDSNLWASCIGGAEQRDNYIQMIEKVGLRVERTKYHNQYSFISDQAVSASEKWGVKSYSFLCTKGEI